MPEIKIIDQMDRGLAYAEACFETMRVIHGVVFELDAHQKRLCHGLDSFAISYSPEQICDYFDQAIAHAKTQGDDILLRLTLSGGDATWGLCRQEEVKLNAYIQCIRPLRHKPLMLRSVQQSWPLLDKSAKYTADYALPLRSKKIWQKPLEGSEQPLFYSDSGHVISTLTANVLVYRHGQWFTPDSLGVLPGVVRNFLLQQQKICKVAIPKSWLDDCESMCCINSGVFIQAVGVINARVLDLRHPALVNLKLFLNQQDGIDLGDVL
ncbi:MAG: aminotransferase class IV [Mariprofundaceae bacterium]